MPPHTLAYALLSYSQTSAEWKQPSEESLETSWFLLDMVGRKGEEKLGVGPPPHGWSAQLD